MRFISLVLKNVFRRPIRSILTALGVALAVGTFVALVGLCNDFVGSISQRYAAQGIDLVVLKSGRAEQVYATLPEKLGAQIKDLPNIEAVCPILFDVVTFEDSDLVGVFIEAWYADSPLFDRVKVLAGRKLAADSRYEAMLGKLLAQNMGKGVGDDIVIDGQPFKVVGTYEVENAFENGGALVLISDLQEIMDRQGNVTGFELILTDDSEQATAETRRQIEALRDPRGKPWNLAATPVEQQASSFIFVKTAKVMAWITSLIAVVIGCVGVLNTMMMSVFERTHEIGVLRAIGWRKSRVVRMIMLEAMAVSVMGAIIGTLAAVLLTRLLAFIPTFRAVVDGNIAPVTIAQGILVACFVAALGSIYPAYRATKQTPTDALRHS
jgi:putative ABC transport system permease protein